MLALGRPRCRAQLYLFSYRDIAGALTGCSSPGLTHMLQFFTKIPTYSAARSERTRPMQIAVHTWHARGRTVLRNIC